MQKKKYSRKVRIKRIKIRINNHTSAECRSKENLKCTKCNKKGHIAKVCITSKVKQGRNQNGTVKQIENKEDDEEDYSINSIKCINLSRNYADKIMVTVKINGHNQQFELDSGSPVTIMSRSDYDKLNLNLRLKKNTNIRLRAYNQTLIEPEATVRVKVTYNNKITEETLFVVSEKLSPFLGRVWIRKLNIINLDNIENNQICQVEPVIINKIVNNIFQTYHTVFDDNMGEIPNINCSLKLKQGATPIYIKPRPVPYALITKVDAELDRLEKQGIIEKTEYCPWGTPLVIVPKSDNGVRICADYSVTVNKQLEDAHFPIPRIQELFTKLKNGKYFCILDIRKAYLHVKMDDESSKIAAISTHRGTFLAKRLFVGLKTAPNIFHSIIDPIINNIDGCVNFFDDIATRNYD